MVALNFDVLEEKKSVKHKSCNNFFPHRKKYGPPKGGEGGIAQFPLPLKYATVTT